MLRPSFVITDICSAEKGKQSRITDEKKIMPQQMLKSAGQSVNNYTYSSNFFPPTKVKVGKKKMKKEILKYFESLKTNSRKLVFKTY